MATTALQLPVDIPWKRLCVSEDMLDKQVCDREFPMRWRSSLAVFSYEPPEDVQAYEGMTVSYLKVVCSITGYQPDPEEVGVKDRKIYTTWSDPTVIENYTDVVNRYYGCYGAIVQVTIGPSPGDQSDDYDWSSSPYFADFEPKKRELYELVSETGEMMSRSLENVNVRKGTTTTDSHEVLDIFGGVNIAGEVAGTGGGVGVSGQWGTKDISQSEYTNLRTTDQAREMRETFSHTTQLTQMYHQLDGYHIGTNRAVFFLLPRPNVVQTETGFVNGPRELEGIQEFFLVVMRPKTTSPPCVEAWLETSHIASVPIFHYQTDTRPLTLHVEKKAEDTGGSLGNDSSTTHAENAETFNPPDGWEIDVERSGGYRIDSISGDRIEAARVASVQPDHVTAYGKVSAWFEDGPWGSLGNVSHDGLLDMVITVYIRKKKPDVSGYTKTLYLTGRGVCCCDQRDYGINSDSVVWEKPLRELPADVPVGQAQSMTVKNANQLRHIIGDYLRRSLNDPARYPAGAVGFADTDIVGGLLSQLVRRPEHPDNQPVTALRNLPDAVRELLRRAAGRVSRGRVLTMSLDEISDRFDLDLDGTLALRRSVVGVAGPDPERGHRYDPPPSIPDLIGRPLADARRTLAGQGMSSGAVEMIDSPRPEGTVLAQYPAPGLYRGDTPSIDLVVSSGLSVVLPETVGRSQGEAVEDLRRAGVTEDPVIILHRTTDEPAGTVLSMIPAAGAAITPGGEIVLVIGASDEESVTAPSDS
ncbi:PASTA domain-containing protein [Sphaerisporangium aureirubrum]|uniref:PASTA domain-containing protein n=1 Tax=Sphaerisporangium aureirubrum TaxID=1544736 RepID=A0ABW1NIY7_9ACTN